MSDNMRPYVMSLTYEKQKELSSHLPKAGLMHSNQKSTKRYFTERWRESSGKLKKIYAGLKKASPDDLNNAFNLMVELDEQYTKSKLSRKRLQLPAKAYVSD